MTNKNNYTITHMAQTNCSQLLSYTNNVYHRVDPLKYSKRINMAKMDWNRNINNLCKYVIVQLIEWNANVYSKHDFLEC